MSEYVSNSLSSDNLEALVQILQIFKTSLILLAKLLSSLYSISAKTSSEALSLLPSIDLEPSEK